MQSGKIRFLCDLKIHISSIIALPLVNAEWEWEKAIANDNSSLFCKNDLTFNGQMYDSQRKSISVKAMKPHQ